MMKLIIEIPDNVMEALKNGNDSRLYSAMWDIYNENNSCVAMQSFENWIYEVNKTESERIKRVIKRIKTNEEALSRYF